LYTFPEDEDWAIVVVCDKKKFYDHPRQGRWKSVEKALAAVVSGAISPMAMPNGVIHSNKSGPKKRKATTTSAKKGRKATTTSAKKGRKATTTSAKKGRKATTTSAKKGRKATAKTVLSEDEDSASYSPPDSSDSEVEETSAPVLARAARSRRAAEAKNATYFESDAESVAESDGDFD
jgi:hypothetical protein